MLALNVGTGPKLWGLKSKGDMAVFHGLCPLGPVKGHLNATVYNDILDGRALPTLWEHDNASVHKARSIKRCCFPELEG